MKTNLFKRIVASSLVATQLLSVSPALAAEIYEATDAASTEVSVRETTEADLAVFQQQLNAVESMSESDLYIQLELQAAQFEAGLKDAEEKGIAVSTEQKEMIQGLVDGIREETAKPKLKKRLGRKLMAIPRGIAQGLGYLGMGLMDIFAAPIIFTTTFMGSLIAGESGNVGGLITGMSIGGIGSIVGTVAVLGYAFPIAIITIVPVNIVSALVCGKKHHKSPYTEKYCANFEKNNDFRQSIGDAGSKSGSVIHNAIVWPFKKLFGKKRHR